MLQNHIVNFFDKFRRSRIFGRLLQGSYFKLSRPSLNSFTLPFIVVNGEAESFNVSCDSFSIK